MKIVKKIFFGLLFVVTAVFLISCNQNSDYEKIFVNRKQITSKTQLEDLLAVNDSIYYPTTFDAIAIESKDVSLAGSVGNDSNREHLGTNVQVENVDEADVIKTDGNFIYYRNSNNGGLYIFEVLKDGTIELKKSIVSEESYIVELYITEDYIITMGNIYQYPANSLSKNVNMIIGFRFRNQGFVNVYNKETLELDYQLTVDNNISFYRLIDNKLYFIYNHFVYKDNLIPTFTENIKGKEQTYEIDYSNIFYFNKNKSYYFSVYNVLNLDDFDLNSEAYLGYVENIYMNEKSLYAISSSYNYENYTSTTEILKFSIDKNGGLKYVAKGNIDGYVLSSYSLDEYKGYLRVVSTTWNPIKNYLFVLKESPYDDSLTIVGLLSEGLGKERETVKSVRFLEDKAYVVTFEQIDPLYTIDLSNPFKPIIINAIEEPGYSTYMHSWDNLGHLIGLGLNANSNGIVNGLKLSAYKDDEEEPLDTYIFSENNNFSWSYSEAIYNPRALLISPEVGIIGFPLSSSGYTIDNGYVYNGKYVIFKIDFNNREQIISKPIVINHPSKSSYVWVERGIYIKDSTFEYIFTFSNLMVITYDLANDQIVQELIIE